MKYDIVGDVHGHAESFVNLIKELGYAPVNGVWQHPERTLISVGDIIDRGPGQRQIVDILKTMQQHGKAIVIMGNHEFYAIAWYLKDKNGQPLRPHSEKNLKEHGAFLDQAQEGSDWYISTIEWLKTLPLFFENDELRCVHAAWDSNHVRTLKQYTDENGVITANTWASIGTLGREFLKALDYSLNGSKLTLPEGYSFVDSGGRSRTKARLKWWDIPSKPTYRNSCTSVPNLMELPDIPISLKLLPSIEGNKPIFFGHYWMQGTPVLMKSNVACLDWSVVVEEGVLAAYRFDGEQTLIADKLVWVKSVL
jgi:hypothetical protein